MKKTLLFLSMIPFLLAMHPVKKKRVIFFGDSITQMGVNPGGYIDVLNKTLSTKGLQHAYELVGAGVGGNKVYDLYLRLEADVLDRKPSLVFIYIGINDVWHKTSGTGTDPDKFEAFYRAIITKLQKRSVRVVVCTPTVIGEKLNDANAQDGDLNRYADAIRRIAREMKCEVADLRQVFTEYLKIHNQSDAPSGILTTDRVHLNDKGNELVANTLLPYLLK
jgi:lysophospholipase L1-like esterase